MRVAPPAAPAAHVHQTTARPQALRPNHSTSFKRPSSSVVAPSALGARSQLTCSRCKKPGHSRKKCKTYQNLCYRCGQAGHRFAECPGKEVAAPGRQVYSLEAVTTGEYIYYVH